MKDKIIEILKEFSTNENEYSWMFIPTDKFPELATCIASLYSGGVSERPIIKQYFKEGATLNDVHEAYINSPELFNYAKALDIYIDSLSKGAKPISEERIEYGIEEYKQRYRASYTPYVIINGHKLNLYPWQNRKLAEEEIEKFKAALKELNLYGEKKGGEG